jgi:hypothetical protein
MTLLRSMCALVLSLGLAAPAFGQAEADDGVGVERLVKQLVEQLGDADWAVRRQATDALMGLAVLPAGVIEAALDRDDLGEERRIRLTRVATARFRERPLGGLGVSFGAIAGGGVQINSVVDNGMFPASQILRIGDVIVMVDDRMIEGQDELRAEILSREPGSVMPAVIRRDRAVLDVGLPLGAYTDLQGAAALDEGIVVRAMRLRAARAGRLLDEPDTVGTGLTDGAWIDAAFPDGRDGDPAQPGDRTSPGVSPGDGAMIRTASPDRRGGRWNTRAGARESVNEMLRAGLGRLMTDRVMTRSVLVELERSLDETVRRTVAEGADASAARARLAFVRSWKTELDALLMETVEQQEALQRP